MSKSYESYKSFRISQKSPSKARARAVTFAAFAGKNPETLEENDQELVATKKNQGKSGQIKVKF